MTNLRIHTEETGHERLLRRSLAFERLLHSARRNIDRAGKAIADAERVDMLLAAKRDVEGAIRELGRSKWQTSGNFAVRWSESKPALCNLETTGLVCSFVATRRWHLRWKSAISCLLTNSIQSRQSGCESF